MNITLWHGGRELEYSYKENLNCSSGRFEHGVGLYLTTHYETAKKYAKGGGKTYKIDLLIEPERSISNTFINLESTLNFLSTYVKKKHLKDISTDISNYLKRTNSNIESIKADIIQNLIINYEAISPSNTKKLTEFLIDNGVDYGLVKNFGGRPETVVVVYNKDIIKKISAIPSKNVSLDEYILPVPESDHNKFLSTTQSKSLSI